MWFKLYQDPLPFAYGSGSGVDQHLAKHNLVTLEQRKDIDCSLALDFFLRTHKVNPSQICWLLDFFNRKNTAC